MTRERIEYSYGPPARRSDLPGSSDSQYYVHGGVLWAMYHPRADHRYPQADHAYNIGTESPYYHTRDGIHVGTKIPLGPCHYVKGQCERRWRDFTWQGRAWWKEVPYGKRRIQILLSVTKGRIDQINFYFFDRYEPDWNAG